MDNKQKFNYLKWKFFWEQKSEEVGEFFKVLVLFLLIILITLAGVITAGLILFGINYIIGMFSNFPLALAIFAGSIIILGLIIGFGFLWIRRNIDKAEARAREAIRNVK